MKKSRFTESRIISILKEVEAGRTGLEVCREHGTSEQTLYRWKKKHGRHGGERGQAAARA